MKGCLVTTIVELAQHPQADNLDIIRVMLPGDLKKQMVVGKHYKVGGRGVFLPPTALLPDDVLEEMWLSGKLNGPGRNRVVAKNFKGIYSEGLFYGGDYGKRWNPEWADGYDVTEAMGVKFDPRFV